MGSRATAPELYALDRYPPRSAGVADDAPVEIAVATPRPLPGLETDLLRLQQEFTVRPSRVRLVLRVRLVDAAARRVLGDRELEVVEPAPADDPYGGVVAANAAAARAVAEVAAACRSWTHGTSPASAGRAASPRSAPSRAALLEGWYGRAGRHPRRGEAPTAIAWRLGSILPSLTAMRVERRRVYVQFGRRHSASADEEERQTCSPTASRSPRCGGRTSLSR